MAEFHPIITIDIAKGYCIQKYSTKSAEVINKKIRELSEDKTNWSEKVLNEIHKIIDENNFNIPSDIMEVHKNRAKILKYKFDDNLIKSGKNVILNAAHQQLQVNDPDATEVIDTSLINKYNKFNDVEMAQIIVLLSKLIKQASTLWITISFTIKELGTEVIFYFKNDGHIAVSKRSKMKLQNTNYIDALNDIIDGKREIPTYM